MENTTIRRAISVVSVLVLLRRCIDGYEVQSGYVEKFKAYSLAEFSTHYEINSEISCATDCIARRDSGNCEAYQWDAETGTCRTQEKLNVTSSVTARYVVGVMSGVLHSDCSAILDAKPASQSGVYYILIGTQQIRQVWCDMDTDGGGWTVFLKRLDGSVDFYLDLAAYKQGFGDVNGEYWLGLDALHTMTSIKSYQLRADIADWEGASVHTLYDSLALTNEADNYRLSLGAFMGGDGGDAFSVNNGSQFSAKDADRDGHPRRSCAQRHHGAFWYNNCLAANPTGKYYSGGAYTNTLHDGIQWRTWEAHDDIYYSMKTVELKIRP